MIISLSHNDLDGISCQLLLKKIIKNEDIIFYQTSYSKIDDFIQIIDENIKTKNVSKVYITDLFFDTRQLSLITQIAKENLKTEFIFIDHHVSSLEASRTLEIPSNMLLYLDIDLCATMLLYIKLGYEYNFDSEEILEYVNKINAYDVWKTETIYFKEGYDLNSLFWEYSKKRYFYEFSKSLMLNSKQLKDIERINKEKDSYFKSLENKGLVKKNDIICVSFTDKFIADIQLRYKGSLFYINATTYGKIQVRIDSTISEDLCLDIQKEIKNKIPEENLINIGGHHHAFGLEHSGAYNHEKIISIVKDIYSIINNKYQ